LHHAHCPSHKDFNGFRVNTPQISMEELDGVTIFVREVGSGPATVVLHGGPGAHHDYLLPQFDRLAVGRTIIQYDQRGGGQSSVPREQDVSWQSHVEDLSLLIEKWDLGPTNILGYSWGGLLAMLFTVSHPKSVARLALVSPAPATAAGRKEFEHRFSERMKDPSIAKARSDLQQSGLRETDPAAYKQRAFELSVAGYFQDPLKTHSLTPFRLTGRVQQSVWNSLGDYDIRDSLSELEIPCLVLHGRHDPIPLETAMETASLLNADFEILENSGHVPYVEETERFVELLNSFLPRASDG
jgi:proline iminopeptidase